ncbi:MAG: FAD-binding and (Fe-S)-binding domain-containing protein [Tropicimonas sp.]|uniref:FAD-binding and (Fe-S)-binding domain-containing protein n=1 Tax=Tropicimonas sp. TaxID=2067044 RepID=UPI003A8B047B
MDVPRPAPFLPEPDAALLALLRGLAGRLEGELRTDPVTRTIYASDASSYREFPLGMVRPASREDLRSIVRFAAEHRIGLIPRGGGTSLAGQVVGSGLVVDMGRFDRVIAFDRDAGRVTVEPGIIRNSLNEWLAPHGVQFGPETSTANRAVIGGMIGNNSCGAHSLLWGSTRDHLISCRAILSDGSEAVFEAIAPDEFHRRRAAPTLEGRLHEMLYRELSDPDARREIAAQYPKPSIRRRNHGYALDLLARSNVFTPDGPDFNMCTLIAGSEGTLCLVTEAVLNVVPLPPPVTGCVTMHFHDSIEALKATLVALKYQPTTCELIGDFHARQALEFQRAHPYSTVAQNSRWIVGEPRTIIVVEFAADTRQEIEARAGAMVAELESRAMGYAWPLWFGEDVERIWALRRALGGINNSQPGDLKACELIEDCALDVADQPEYVRQLEGMLDRAGVPFVHSAHAGDGELHTIVFLNLKTRDGTRLFRDLLEKTAALVKRFGGSLAGEHGDGRMRAEFLPMMIGERNYALCQRVKAGFDPGNIFNPGKIVDVPPMDSALRYSPERATPEIATVFNWDRDLGILRAVERCSGLGECRKIRGGVMCPSYMATREEKDTTRARANVLREFLTNSTKANRFDHREIRDVLDLCLSCKGCKSECPANVDMARLKAESLQHYHDAHWPGLRAHLIAGFAPLMGVASRMAPLANFLLSNRLTGGLAKRAAGFAPARSMPRVCGLTLSRWYRRNHAAGGGRRVHLFCDEFTEFNDAAIGIAAVKLLTALGYQVVLVRPGESGRAMISQGFLRRARKCADRNVAALAGRVSDAAPLIAIEPSTISCFRDEYPDLVSPDLRGEAAALARKSLMFEEFIAREMDQGHIGPQAFTNAQRQVRVHVHCHQKSLSSPEIVRRVLSLPRNYSVREIPGGCCGMAGAFGYEVEHYALSMRIGEMALLPAVRAAGEDIIFAASGTSCRHQIKDGTGRHALHTAEILYDALKARR